LVGQGRGLIGLTPLEVGREGNSVALKRTLGSLVTFMIGLTLFLYCLHASA